MIAIPRDAEWSESTRRFVETVRRTLPDAGELERIFMVQYSLSCMRMTMVPEVKVSVSVL